MPRPHPGWTQHGPIGIVVGKMEGCILRRAARQRPPASKMGRATTECTVCGCRRGWAPEGGVWGEWRISAAAARNNQRQQIKLLAAHGLTPLTPPPSTPAWRGRAGGRSLTQ
eukprot:gene25511-58813_t